MSKATEPVLVIVLAAGMGSRMKSPIPKVLMEVGGRSLVEHVLDAASCLQPERYVVVIGHQGEKVKERVLEGGKTGGYDPAKVTFAVQEEIKGTGDAVKTALDATGSFTGTVLIAIGDEPLITPETFTKLIEQFHESKSTVSVVTAELGSPAAYGRIIRSAEGDVEKIVEAKDCSEAELRTQEVNAAVYAVDSAFLTPAVKSLQNENVQGEYYLTDIVGKAVVEGQTVSAYLLSDPNEMLGVNTRSDLSLVREAYRKRLLKNIMNSGVDIEHPDSVFIDDSVTIEEGVYLGPDVQLRGKTSVATGTKIEGNAFISDSVIENNCHIKYGVRIDGAHVGKCSAVGPFAHLRPGTVLVEDVKVGNFVETKKSTLQKGVKASHLSYLGDAEVGEDANIGAGTITCNYDGFNKYKTEIGKGAFIGSNTSIIAPVKIGEGASIGAGSAISKNVDQDALAFTRSKQVSKEGWAKRKREK